MKPEVSIYLREMQRRSAEARWSGLSSEQRAEKMSALAKARWAKTKRKPKRAAREICKIGTINKVIAPEAMAEWNRIEAVVTELGLNSEE